MGLNDTEKLGLHRPVDLETAWGDGDDDSLNFNFTRIEKILVPETSYDIPMRIVAPGFAGLSVPTTAKIFGTIQEAIDDCPVNAQNIHPIMVYPGIYNEELEIIDRSVHLYSAAPFHGEGAVYENVVVQSGRNNGGATTGKPCVTVKLRTGKDDNDSAERTPAQIWTNLDGRHASRYKTKIMFSGFSFDNYGHYYTDVEHDATTTYYLDCTDNGVPPYYGQYSYIVFNNCTFRCQTWHDYSYNGGSNDGPIVGWFQRGFHVRSYATHLRFHNCAYHLFNYGGGTYGSQFFSQVNQPFLVGTDGTSFIGWQRAATGDDRYDGNVNGSQKGYYYNRSTIRFVGSNFFATERNGSWSSAPPGYVGNAWNYGHDSDSSCALVTLFSMGHFIIRNSTFYPSVWASETGFGPDPDDPNISLSNYVHKYDEGAPWSVEPTVTYGGGGVEITGCTTDGLMLTGIILEDTEMLNVAGNRLGSTSDVEL